MNPRSIALFAALVLSAGACSNGTDSDSVAVSDRESGRAGAPAATMSVELSAQSATDSFEEPIAPPVPNDEQLPPAPVPEERPTTNPVTKPAEDALSTFAMDVDTGSYTYARGNLQAGVIPDAAVVRTEEFVNALEQDYTPPTNGDTFALTVEGTTAPFLPGGSRIVRVGIQGKSVADENRPDANLTIVIDISGSMADPGKLDAVRPALDALVETLRPTDRVAIVVYSDNTRTLLDSTPVSERQTINAAIDGLQPEGSTNVEDGLRLGYDVARASLDESRINRVMLLSDGVANVGETGPEAILEVIGDASRDGIDLVTIGFGLGDYNDTLMEQLADQGDGFYAYVDGEGEAVRLFGEDLTGTLQTIAREAKVQVEFNPATVASYRLIGFENRGVADEDFRDDTVDGGEIGAGHTVTALYEVSMVEGASDGEDTWLARSVIRWTDPDTNTASELDATLNTSGANGSIGDAPLRFQQDIYIAAFAETMRGSGWNGLIGLDGVADNLHSLAERIGDDRVEEAADLVDMRIQLG